MLFPAEGLRLNEMTRCCQNGLEAVAPFGTVAKTAGENDIVCPPPADGQRAIKETASVAFQIFMFSR